MPDIDYSRATVRYPQPVTPEMGGRADTSVDYSAPTIRYPMAPPTGLRVVDALKDADGLPIDFGRSADRYPMYGEPAPQKAARPSSKEN